MTSSATFKDATQPRHAWLAISLATLICVFASALHWQSHNHPPLTWDEAEYLNAAYRDAAAFHSHGLSGQGLFHSLLYMEQYRPPAHRLFALPMTLVFGVGLISLRVYSLFLFLLAAGFLCKAVSTVAGRPAGLLAAALMVSSFYMIRSSKVYYTEPCSFLSITASMYFLFRIMLIRSRDRWSWIGLGFFMGTGMLAKLSFPWIFGLMFAMAAALAIFRQLPANALFKLTAAALLAALVAAPWYVLNARNYLELAKISQHWDRVPLATAMLARATAFLKQIVLEGIGPGVSTLIALALLTATAFQFIPLLKSKTAATPQGRWIPLFFCLLGGSIFPLANFLLSTNYDLRILTPALIPLFAAAAILLSLTPFYGRKSAIAIATLLLGWQVFTLVWFKNQNFALWDVSPVRDIAWQHGLETPTIAFIGESRDLNPEALLTPFIKKGQEAKSVWLWNYTQPLDWDAIHTAALDADLVIVPPVYDGVDMAYPKADLDNAHNRELDDWLSRCGFFNPPVSFVAGANLQSMVNVYVRNRKPPG